MNIRRANGKVIPEYASWQAMLRRCLTPNNPKFSYYGGRGITVADELRTFDGFMRVLGPRPDGHTLDRINNDGNYEPSNVRWANRKTQARNCRSNKPVTHNGETLTIPEWAERFGMNKGTLWDRIRTYGMTLEEAVNAPIPTMRERAIRGASARWSK